MIFIFSHGHLLPVNSVQGLVDEEAEGAGGGGPPGRDLGGGGAVGDQHQGGDDVHGEPRHRDQVGRHPQRHQRHEPAVTHVMSPLYHSHIGDDDDGDTTYQFQYFCIIGSSRDTHDELYLWSFRRFSSLSLKI